MQSQEVWEVRATAQQCLEAAEEQLRQELVPAGENHTAAENSPVRCMSGMVRGVDHFWESVCCTVRLTNNVVM